jgi:hypothetical protein
MAFIVMREYVVVYKIVGHVSKCLVLVNCIWSMILLGIGLGQRIVACVHCPLEFEDVSLLGICDKGVVPEVCGGCNVNVFVTSPFINF